MKVIAFLPAKGSSERIESKNIKLLDGKPLFLHTLEKLSKCSFIDEVYLDTESDEVIDLASEVDCKVLKRDPKLATNKTDGHQLFMNEVKQVDGDIYIQILGTSPFIEIESIQKGVEKIKEGVYDSAVLIKKEKQYLWKSEKPLYNIDHIPNSVDLEDTIIETMGLYLINKEAALKTNRRFGEKVFFLKASPLESIDVNYEEEFLLANLIAAGRREKERQLFQNLSGMLTSSMLSDILDGLGLDGVISTLSLNLKEKKMMGYAKTLKLKKLEKGEDYRSIYDALKSYDTIVPQDIIVVENECSEYAYFGELNANLAIRQGAAGAIIGGKTRDTAEVAQLDFPVFSTGSNCKDVRQRAGLASINKKINLYGIDISPGDLIFADNDGVIIIPARFQDQVIAKALQTIQKEKNILLKITTGDDQMKLLRDIGEF